MYSENAIQQHNVIIIIKYQSIPLTSTEYYSYRKKYLTMDMIMNRLQVIKAVTIQSQGQSFIYTFFFILYTIFHTINNNTLNLNPITDKENEKLFVNIEQGEDHTFKVSHENNSIPLHILKTTNELILLLHYSYYSKINYFRSTMKKSNTFILL